MLDQALFKECALAVDVSEYTNRWFYFPNCNVRFKSIIEQTVAPEYRVLGSIVTGNRAMFDQVVFKERALVVEVSGDTTRCLQLPTYILELESITQDVEQQRPESQGQQ